MHVGAITWWDFMEATYRVITFVAEFLWDNHRLLGLLFLIAVMLIAVWNLRAMTTLGRPRSRMARGRSLEAGADAGPASADAAPGSSASIAGRRLPRVSVLVPAGNEEKNIGRCIESLLAQDYPDFEVLVLDDESTDGTAAVAAALASSSVTVRLVCGRPLPVGWVGKVWACHQLSQEADGELYLFTDADTWHHPLSLRDAVAELLAEDADLVTGLPRQETRSIAERVVVPVISWAMLSLLPIGVAQRIRTPLLSAGIGQFMLFRAAAYRAVGGHGAIKDEVVDDMALARSVRSEGLRWRFVDAVPRVSCRMYRDRRGVVEGLTKSIFPALGSNVPLTLAVFTVVAFSYLEPVVLLGGLVFGWTLPVETVVWALVCIGLALVSWTIVSRRAGYPAYQPLLYPLTIAVVLAIGLRSVVLTVLGRATWKGRRLAPDDTVA